MARSEGGRSGREPGRGRLGEAGRGVASPLPDPVSRTCASCLRRGGGVRPVLGALMLALRPCHRMLRRPPVLSGRDRGKRLLDHRFIAAGRWGRWPGESWLPTPSSSGISRRRCRGPPPGRVEPAGWPGPAAANANCPTSSAAGRRTWTCSTSSRIFLKKKKKKCPGDAVDQAALQLSSAASDPVRGLGTLGADETQAAAVAATNAAGFAATTASTAPASRSGMRTRTWKPTTPTGRRARWPTPPPAPRR